LRFLKLHTSALFSWPKAIFTVAWGIAPGIRTVTNRLAEGHIHRERQGAVNMAFGQENALFSRVPGALPQATVTVGLRPTPEASRKSATSKLALRVELSGVRLVR
jgi:hypothetical protein